MDEVVKEPFFKLMNLEKKYARYTNHQNYLKECETRNVISKGFILRKSANIGHVSMSFKNDWDEILEDGSHRLQRLLTDELSLVLTSLQEQRETLIARLPEQQNSEYREKMRSIVNSDDFFCSRNPRRDVF